MKFKVLIISYSNLGSDPRVLRQIQTLTSDHEIIEAGRKPSGKGNPFIELKEIQSFHVNYPFLIKKSMSLVFKLYREIYLLRIARNFEKYYWDFLRENILVKLISYKPDVVIANDVDALPLAISIKRKTGAKVVLDAHEYAPLQVTNLEYWKKYISPYKFFLSKAYIPSADFCFTVSKGIADEYESLTGKSFSIFRNSPKYLDISPSKTKNDRFHLIHHGAAIPGRSLELMFDIMELLDERFILNLILVPTDQKYYLKLVERASANKQIIIHDPVPTEQITTFINQFDLGIFILPPSNFNYKHALPNKFFEFIQARLGVIIGPSVEMQSYVKDFDIGVVANDFTPESISSMINSLDLHQIKSFKENAHKAAEELAIDQELKFFSQTVKRLL